MPDPIDNLDIALARFCELVACVQAQQWDAATPCGGWSVRDVVNHVAAGNLMTASVLDDGSGASPARRAEYTGRDFLGLDPPGALRASADRLVASLHRPGVMQRPVEMPIGTVPGATVARLRQTETVVHGWDVAAAIGVPIPFDEGAVGQALEFTTRALADLPPNNRAFAAPVAPPPDATSLQRLLCHLGRDPGWSPSGTAPLP